MGRDKTIFTVCVEALVCFKHGPPAGPVKPALQEQSVTVVLVTGRLALVLACCTSGTLATIGADVTGVTRAVCHRSAASRRLRMVGAAAFRAGASKTEKVSGAEIL